MAYRRRFVNMKCYFHYDEKTKTKVLIPGCWGTVHTGEIEDCICQDFKSEAGFARKRYNEMIKEKNEEITFLRKEVDRLNKRLEYWHKKAK